MPVCNVKEEVKKNKNDGANHNSYRQEIHCCVRHYKPLKPNEYCLQLKAVFARKQNNVQALIRKVKHKAENTTQLGNKWL